MSLADLSNVLKIFGGGEPSAAEQQELFKETILMTLSRATSADSNIDPAEVDAVRASLLEATGEDISAADIRYAAASELYEKAPLDKYLAKAGRKLDVRQRVMIVQKLADIIRSDSGVREREIEFFDMVAGALSVTPAQLAGLFANKP